MWPGLEKNANDATTTTKIDIPHAASIGGLNPWTMGGWIRHDGTGGGAKPIAAKGTIGSNNRRIYMDRVFTTALRVQLDGSTDCTYTSGDGAVPVNVWTFIAAAFSSAFTTPERVRLYSGQDEQTFRRVPSSRNSTDGVSLVADPGTALELFNNGAASDAFYGQMSFWFLSNQRLGFDELREILVDHRSAPIRGCVGRWYPGEYGTLVVPDHSGYGNHGTPSGLQVSAHMFPHIDTLSRR